MKKQHNIKAHNCIIHDGYFIKQKYAYNDVLLEKEYSFLSRLKAIPSLCKNVPSNLLLNSNGALSMKFYEEGSLDKYYFNSYYPEVDIRILKKVLALFNKLNSISLKNLGDQRLPIPTDIYLRQFWSQFRNDNPFAKKYPYWIINGTIYKDIYQYEEFNKVFNSLCYLCKTYRPHITHGNFMLSHLLKDGNNLIIICPRGSYGNGNSILGDPRADLAKLRFSIEGCYELIVNKKFNVISNTDNIYNYEFTINKDTKAATEYLDKFIIDNSYDLNMIKMLECCCFMYLIPEYDDIEIKKLLYMRALERFIPLLDNILDFSEGPAEYFELFTYGAKNY